MQTKSKKVNRACDLLYDASRFIRILTHLSWPQSVRLNFFFETKAAIALAGHRRICDRRDAVFTDEEVQQLINHEAHIHVAT